MGGIIRWMVDRHLARKHKGMTEEELVAEGDKSPGVLMASGYIAGAALAGIVYAFMAGYFTDAFNATKEWMLAHNPMFDEAPVIKPYADLLSLIPFILITVALYGVGRVWILAANRRAEI